MLPPEHALGVDHENRAAQARTAERDAVQPGNRQALIGEQREREVVLPGELLVTGQALRANGPDVGAEAGEAFQARGRAELPRADRGIVALVEGKDERLAALLRQRVVGMRGLTASQSALQGVAGVCPVSGVLATRPPSAYLPCLCAAAVCCDPVSKAMRYTCRGGSRPQNRASPLNDRASPTRITVSAWPPKCQRAATVSNDGKVRRAGNG